MTEEEVDRLAKLAHRTRHQRLRTEHPWLPAACWEDEPDYVKEDYRAMVRAIVAELRP
jgi:hypothetical protein